MLRLLPFALVASAIVAGQQAPEAIWGASFGGNRGRTGQVSGAINGPRLLPTDPAPYNHILKVRWRWVAPGTTKGSRGITNTFFYGAIDADHYVYYLGTRNGAGPEVVYKVSPSDGSLVWQSNAPPIPRYPNFYGNDHLLVHSNQAVYVIQGTTYTLADCAYVQKLDASTGKQQWLLNGTATIANAVLSADGATLYLSYANGTVSAVNTAGEEPVVTGHWDISHLFSAGSLPGVGFYMTLSPAAEGKVQDDVLLFSLPPSQNSGGNNSYAALVTTGGDPSNALLWSFEDPLGGAFNPILVSPTSGPLVGQWFFSEGNNYMQGQGSAAFDTLTGKERWQTTSSNVISASTQLSAEQGFLWSVNYLGSGSYSTLSVYSAQNGSQIPFMAQYYQTPGFTSALSISGDGFCGSMYGSGMIEDQDEVNLLSYCLNSTNSLNPEWNVPITGVNAPNAHYQLVPGPYDGEYALFHDSGVMLLERYELQDAPKAPADPTGGKNGLVVSLVMAKTDASCLNGGGNVTLTPAVVVPSADGPKWVLGQSVPTEVFSYPGTCNAYGSDPAIDVAGGRAWFPFACSNIVTGQYVTFLAEVDILQEKPVVKGLCQSRYQFAPMFYDAKVNTSSPWLLDIYAEFTRYFYTITVPPLSSWDPSTGANMPYCSWNAIGQLGPVGLLPGNAQFAGDGDGNLVVASSTDWGMRLMMISVPAGQPLGDVTLPCDTSICVRAGGVGFVGVTRDSSATPVIGGSPAYYQDWPSNAATLAYALFADNPQNYTFTGLVSTQYPTFPFMSPSTGSTVGFLPDPNPPDAGEDEHSWIQSLYLGPVACTNATYPAYLQSVAFFGAQGPQGNVSTLVVNSTIPACPLPLSSGLRCYSMGVTHVQAFTS